VYIKVRRAAIVNPELMKVNLLRTRKFSILHSEIVESRSTDAGYIWLSKRLLDVTGGSVCIEFNQKIIRAIEGDIQKCRETRLQFQNNDFLKYGYRVLLDICDDSFKLLAREIDVKFDYESHPIGQSFATMLGLYFDQLPLLHMKFSQDKGRLKDRHEKRRLLKNILDPVKRNPFQAVFLNFFLKVIAPHVQSITQSSRIYFQSFPCIRVVRPGEFSIGPHCDASYGFSQGNINFYVPLTKIFGTNSLILESTPGLEDWHTIELDYGSLKRFYGSQCSHFTAENTTDQTRISLDFRVILEEHWQEDHDHFSSTPGYYASCKFVPFDSKEGGTCPPLQSGAGGANLETPPQGLDTSDSPISRDGDSMGLWVLEQEILEPDWRVGFPFEKHSMTDIPQGEYSSVPQMLFDN
jgi:hypothetical protein